MNVSKREYQERTLGWWMEERRGELGLTWEEVAAEAGVSVVTLRRNAGDDLSGMRVTTKKGIERALRWDSGSVDAITRGGEPTRLAEESAAPRSRPRHEWTARQRAKILAMSFEDTLDLADQIRSGSGESAAWTWLREAARLKLEAAGVEARRQAASN